MASLVTDLHQAKQKLPGAPIVAHGLGATLAAMAAEGEDRPQVWLGPLLGHTQTPLSRDLTQAEVPGSVGLDAVWTWRGRDPVQAWVGDGAPLGCLSTGVARDLLAWTASFPEILPYRGPVVAIVSLGDSFAPVEDTVPALLRYPAVRIVRVGRNRLAPDDPGHLALWSDPGVWRVVVSALRRARHGGQP